MAASRVKLVVSGSTAMRIHGAPIPLIDLEIRTRGDDVNSRLLRMALAKGNRRLSTIGLTARSCEPARFDAIWGRATLMHVSRDRAVAVEALDDLIEAASPERAALLRHVREEGHSAAAEAGGNLRRF